MRMRLAIAALVLLVGAIGAPNAADGPYQLIKEVQIGGDGGWDYLNIDGAAKRLYISHASKVVVYDLATDKVIGEIADTPGVHGAVIGPNGHIFTSNGRENKASMVDGKTFQTIAKIDTEGNPDFIMYEPKRKEIYTMNGTGKSATVINADGKVIATIPLGGKPEAGVSDPAADRVYINNETASTIVVVDATKHEVVANWPIAPGATQAGLAIDVKNHRLFVGARNSLMVMMDSTNGTVLAQVPIGAGVDATVFDPVTGYAMSSSGGDGTTTIAKGDSSGKLTIVQSLKTARGARTMALDPATHRIYLAAAKYQDPAPDAPANARPVMVPGSMHVLVYGIDGK